MIVQATKRNIVEDYYGDIKTQNERGMRMGVFLSENADNNSREHDHYNDYSVVHYYYSYLIFFGAVVVRTIPPWG